MIKNNASSVKRKHDALFPRETCDHKYFTSNKCNRTCNHQHEFVDTSVIKPQYNIQQNRLIHWKNRSQQRIMMENNTGSRKKHAHIFLDMHKSQKPHILIYPLPCTTVSQTQKQFSQYYTKQPLRESNSCNKIKASEIKINIKFNQQIFPQNTKIFSPFTKNHRIVI